MTGFFTGREHGGGDVVAGSGQGAALAAEHWMDRQLSAVGRWEVVLQSVQRNGPARSRTSWPVRLG